LVFPAQVFDFMQNPSAPAIILASSSAYRRGLLDRFLHSYETVSPDIDESNVLQLGPKELAQHLAREKAETVSMNARSSLIIGADQLAVLDGRVLGKPGNHQKAVEQLLAASGQSVAFLTAVCILDPVGRARYEHVDETKVQFRQFDRRLAESYLRHDEPYDCAGSFKIEGAGFVLFESVRTDDPTALIGLPMIWVSDVLLELGYLAQ
jgi:septum formation protein